MFTFKVDQNAINQQEITLNLEDSYHLSRVLRFKVKNKIHLATKEGRLFEARIISLGKEVSLKIEKELVAPPIPLPLCLNLAYLKKEKMEWVIQKAVELNIACVQLIRTKRSVRNEISPHQAERFLKIALEAQKQCGRVIPLQINHLLTWDQALEKIDLSQESHFFCYEEAKTNLLTRDLFQDKSKFCYLWIGPEGGWDQQEYEQALTKNMRIISLGPLILRAETAALFALSSTITLMSE